MQSSPAMHLFEPAGHPFRTIALVGGIVGGAAAAVTAVVWDVSDSPDLVIAAPPFTLAPAAAVVAAPVPAPVAAPAVAAAPADAAQGDIDFIFEAGGARWVALDDGSASDMTAHGRPVVVDDSTAIARVKASRLPATTRAWRGKDVLVDGTCRDKLEKFAYIARVDGTPEYASDGGGDAHWTAKTIAAHGNVVLAARLSHCKGTFAQPADAATAVVFERVTGAAASAPAAKAHDVLMASSFATKAAEDWKSVSSPWTKDVRFDVIVARDPRRGTTWVSAHAHTDGVSCGYPSASFWGLFRVRADGSLEQVALRALDNLGQIDALVDLDGDGTPDVLGSSLLPTGPVALDADGDTISELAVPFFGCPC